MQRLNLVCFWLVILVLTSFLSGCSGTSPQARHDRFLAAGKKLLEKQDYARALLEFKNAARLMPKDPEAEYQLGLATLGLHDLPGAMVWFEKAPVSYTHLSLRFTSLAEITRMRFRRIVKTTNSRRPTPVCPRA